VKTADVPEHQYICRVVLGLDFEQCKRVLADPFAVQMDNLSPDCQLGVTDLQSSEAMRVTSMAETKTLWALTSLSASDIVSLRDNALVQPSVFRSTFGSSDKAAYGIDWTC